ncbi:MAG: class II glutamine amidotransferase [Oscillospiraceae bacterium]|nr:class II glutamine amidotransferase [Oscillospiraceae bacterium]MBQ9045826.1 class II glutamine amidotransferase [Oscillospiraceae bacterium]
MCELFGFSGRAPRDLAPELRVFFSHGAQNPNGWGMAQRTGGVFRLETEAAPSHESAYLSELLENPVTSALLLAHIRKATIGDIRLENCHPFYGQDASGRGWMLMHNGTVFSGLSTQGFRDRLRGTTDSELLFYYLLERQNTAIAQKGAALTAQERFLVSEALIVPISRRNKLNLIFTDGELLYVHVNMRGTLHSRSLPEGTLFSTLPLTDDAWEAVPMTRLLAYENGVPVIEGQNHGNEYIPGVEQASSPLDFVI